MASKIEEVISNALKLATRGKGILASDESTGTVGKRLKAVGLVNEEKVRRAYREVRDAFVKGNVIPNI